MQLGLFAINVHDLTGCDVAKLDATYCADTIGTSSRTRKPYRFNGYEWVSVSGMHQGRKLLRIKAYRLVPLEEFDGPTHRYGDVLARNLDEAMSPQRLSYHGMLVTCEGKQRVMCGPAVTLEGTEDAPLWIEPETRWQVADDPDDDDDDGDYDDENYGEHACMHGVSYDEICEECLEENDDDEDRTDEASHGSIATHP